MISLSILSPVVLLSCKSISLSPYCQALLHFYEGLLCEIPHFYEGLLVLPVHFYEGVLVQSAHFYEGVAFIVPNFNAEYYFSISIQPDSPTLICTIH